LSKVSIVIPCRSETYEVSPGVSVIARTVQDIFEKATGDIEVIVGFDGPPYTPIPDHENLIVLHRQWEGTKPTINAMVDIANGKYIMKADGHCMFSEGFDETLQIGMEDNWVVMPRFYVLDAENWRWQDDRFYDYFFLPCPFTYKRGFLFQAGGHWKERTRERLDITPLDENMKLHGSAFFMAKEHFVDRIGYLHSDGSGTWNGEDAEITFKTWLGPWGGKIMVNKAAWYAHMHRGGQRPREWPVSMSEAYGSAKWTAKYWMSNQWGFRVHNAEWLIDKFWPLPGWPDDWKDLYKVWLAQQEG